MGLYSGPKFDKRVALVVALTSLGIKSVIKLVSLVVSAASSAETTTKPGVTDAGSEFGIPKLFITAP